ncbi:hypothetical protein [Pseudomonas sp. MH10]|uniref:hypothetical protein n=1 Tax=Pseudomonas sp. MH10 TaxID=3048627 RepID=UPI002AC8FA38|nr:hypothetical protein [Pseudomonas sp. MH10]MEB0039363.1 hypothetical protein [Pseudomonas sp. MH10]WPX62306.1 hypothetical protein RHM59_15315 [Pseudomonas sp. MH10]
MNSDYKAVTDQSGLFAGAGGYDINVGKTTALQGAVIASEASVDKNRLNTDRLIVNDIKNIIEIESQSVGLAVSSSSAGGASIGGSIPVALKDEDRSHTRSAVSEGTIVVRNAESANDLVGLNHDTANANQKLDRPDEKAMKERIELIQSTAQLASGIISTVAKASVDEAKERLKTAKSPSDVKAAEQNLKAVSESWAAGGDKRVLADIASGIIAAALGGAGGSTSLGIVANTTAADAYQKIGDYADRQRDVAGKSGDLATQAAWDEGGAARILLHTLAGATQGLSGGVVGASAMSAGVTGLTVPLIAEKVAQLDIPVDVKKALISSASGFVAAGVGGIAGANAGLLEVQNNYLKHTDIEVLSKQLAVCAAGNTACRQQVITDAKRMSDANDAELMACKDQQCLNIHIAQIFEGAKSFGDLYAADKAINSKDKTTFGAISDIETNSLLMAANMASGLPSYASWAGKHCESAGSSACQAKFSDAVKSGTFINSQGLPGGVIPEAFQYWETVFGDTRQPHEYSDVTKGCIPLLGGCGSLIQAYEALRRNAGPGGDGIRVVNSGDVSELHMMGAKLGHVAHLTDDSTMSVINITLPGMHALDPGFVIRTVQPTQDGAFNVKTHGWGTGPSPLFNSNSWAAYMVWGGNTTLGIAWQELINNSPERVKKALIPAPEMPK